MAFNTTALTSYVEEHRLPLIAKSVLSAKSAKLFGLQTGVKGPTALNLINTDAVLQDGSACGWNASGDTVLSQRIITPAVLKVNNAWCDKSLLKTWANYEVRIAAEPDKALPFEEYITQEVCDSVAAQVEKMIWQGQSGQTNQFEGLVSILSGCSGTTHAAGTTAYAAIKNAYMSMAEEVASKDDAVIFVSDGTFRKFIQELVAANLYHFEPTDVEGEYKLPGTACRVISVGGLNGTADYDYVVAGRLSNFYYGTDMEGDEEVFDLWYSRDHQEHRLAIGFTAGVQVAYPDEVIVDKITK